MKKYVKAATNISDLAFEGIYDTLLDITDDYYDLDLSKKDLKVTLTPKQDFLPNIDVETFNNNGNITFEAIVNFFPINTEDDGATDYCEYVVDKWMDAAKVADGFKRTKINIQKFNNMYSE